MLDDHIVDRAQQCSFNVAALRNIERSCGKSFAEGTHGRIYDDLSSDPSLDNCLKIASSESSGVASCHPSVMDELLLN